MPRGSYWPPLRQTGEDNWVVPASHGSAPSNRIWNITMLPEAADLAQNRPLWRMMSTYGATQSWVACQKRRRRSGKLCVLFAQRRDDAVQIRHIISSWIWMYLLHYFSFFFSHCSIQIICSVILFSDNIQVLQALKFSCTSCSLLDSGAALYIYTLGAWSCRVKELKWQMIGKNGYGHPSIHYWSTWHFAFHE